MTATPSPHDIIHMEDILSGYGNWFSAELLRLIAKADLDNRELLRRIYPNHVAVFENFIDGYFSKGGE